jgi:hypothetical protein
MLDFPGVFTAGKTIQVVLAPRGSWKSGIGTIGDATHEICVNPNVSGQILAESQETGKKFLSEIKQHLTQNETLEYFYGKHESTTGWTRTEITTCQRTIIAKEPTLEVLGVGGRLVGRRAQIQWGDDMVSPINSATEQLRKKLLDWWNTVVCPMLNPGGVQKIRGTRYFTRDLYFSLKDMYGADAILRLPAIVQDEEGNEKSYWPERFPLHMLQELRKQDPISFATQYNNDISGLLSSIITPGVLKVGEAPCLEECIGFMGVDPARKADGPGSYFAIVLIAQHTVTQQVYILYEYAWKLATPDKMLKQIRDVYDWWQSRGLTIYGINLEDNGFQGVLAQAAMADPVRYGVLPWMPSTTVKDKATCFIAQAKYFNMGLVHISAECHRLMLHILSYPDCEIKDLIDAMVRAFEIMDSRFRPGVLLDFDIYKMVEDRGAFLQFG